MFNQDFKEFIESLNENKVRYLIVGGYAVAVHGYPRYTYFITRVETDLSGISRKEIGIREFTLIHTNIKSKGF